MKNTEYRKVQAKFLSRGLVSATKARRTGYYVSADKVLEKLERRLNEVRTKTS